MKLLLRRTLHLQQFYSAIKCSPAAVLAGRRLMVQSKINNHLLFRLQNPYQKQFQNASLLLQVLQQLRLHQPV